MPNLVLIHGLKFSGKSTIAEHLMRTHGFDRVKMAGPLKNMVRSLLRDAGILEDRIEDYVEGERKEEPIPELGGVTSRSLMMTLGEEWRNMHGERLWANIASAKIESLLNEGRDVVVDDIRYRFEVEALSKFVPFTMCVTRGGLHFEPYGEDRHPGERPMPVQSFDCHIRNDYESKDDLWSMVDLLWEAHRDYRERLSTISKAA